MELEIVPRMRDLVRESSSHYLPTAPPATANRGLLNLGDGPFDGSTAGFFAGSASGTFLAFNAASGFGGNLADLQVAGVRKFSVNADGQARMVGGGIINNAQTLSFAATDGSLDGALSMTGANTLLLQNGRANSLVQVNGGVGGGVVLTSSGGSTKVRVDDTGLAFFGVGTVAQPAAIADAAGGATIDAEARTALNALLSRLRNIGLLAT